MEQNLRLEAEDRSVVLQRRADQDVEVIARLCRERDELCQTTERLCSEHGTVREERDWAI